MLIQSSWYLQFSSIHTVAKQRKYSIFRQIDFYPLGIFDNRIILSIYIIFPEQSFKTLYAGI
jgi:hypothetical protein